MQQLTHMLQLSFTLQASEIIGLTRNKHLRWMRWLYWPMGILAVLVAAVGYRIEQWEVPLVYGISMVLIVGFYEWYFPKMLERNFRKLPSWGKPVHFTFEDTHIFQKTAYSESTLQWESIRRAEELPDWFLLHLGPKMVFIGIPKRAFEDAATQDKFRSLLGQKGLLPTA